MSINVNKCNISMNSIHVIVSFNNDWYYSTSVTKHYPLASKIGISNAADFPPGVAYYGVYNIINSDVITDLNDEIYDDIYKSPIGYITISNDAEDFKITCSRVISWSENNIHYISPDTNHVGGSYSHFNLNKSNNGNRLNYFAKVINAWAPKIDRLLPGTTFDVYINWLSVS